MAYNVTRQTITLGQQTAVIEYAARIKRATGCPYRYSTSVQIKIRTAHCHFAKDRAYFYNDSAKITTLCTTCF